MDYRLLALDIDGTLIGRQEHVDQDVLDALRAAQEAGLRICLATGRSYQEAMPIWRQLPLRQPVEPLVVVGGALVSEGDSGRTLYQRTVPRELAAACADAMTDAGFCVVAAVDGWRHGVDYYHTARGLGDEAQKRWLGRIGVRVRVLERLYNGEPMPPPLRLSVVAPTELAVKLADDLSARFQGELNIHSIFVPAYDITVVEAFSAATTKYTALTYLAQGMRIAPRQIVAVGDEVNDIPMIRSAALGVAMPQAPQSVKSVAKHVAAGGLAAFIHELIEGRFDRPGELEPQR